MAALSGLLAMAAIVLTGCESSNSTPDPVVVTNIVVVTNAPPEPAPTYPNVYGNWSGSRNGVLFQMHIDQIDGGLSGSFTGASGEAGSQSGTISGNHIVLRLTFTAGAAAGYFETWDGNINAAITDFTGTCTPGNGGMPSAFALHK